MTKADPVKESLLDRRIREAREDVRNLRRIRRDLDNPLSSARMYPFGERDLSGERKTADIDLGSAQAVLGELLLQQARQVAADEALAEKHDASDDDLRADAQKREERREFWFRRFNLSLSLAHGAGLAAITSKVFDKDIAASAVAGTWWSMASFAIGLAVAGMLPIALYLERPKIAWWMSGASALLFLWALAVALAGAARKAQHIWPFW